MLCWESIGKYALVVIDCIRCGLVALVVNIALVVNMCALVVSECIRCGIVVLVANVCISCGCVPVWWF